MACHWVISVRVGVRVQMLICKQSPLSSEKTGQIFSLTSFPVLHCMSYIALTNPSAANGLVALALCLENKRPCTLETAKSFLVGILQLFIPALIASCRPKSNRRVTGWRYLDQSFNIQRGAQEKMKGAS